MPVVKSSETLSLVQYFTRRHTPDDWNGNQTFSETLVEKWTRSAYVAVQPL